MGTRRVVGTVVGCAVTAAVAAGWVSPATAASSPPVGAKEWASQVCSATRTWTHDVERAASRAQKSFAEDALSEGPLTALLAYLGAAADATETLTGAAKDAGVPDVRRGRDSARVLTQTLAGIETGFRHARRDLVPLRASTDPDAIAAGVADARAQVDETITTGLGALDEVLGSGALARAAARVKACRALSG